MNQELKDWTIAFLKNKDLAYRRIEKIEEDAKNSLLNVKFKDKTVKHHIIERLDDKIFPKLADKDGKTIACMNSEDNLKFLIKHWKKFSDIMNLNIIFVNLKNNDKWMINPKLHSMIADPDSIEQGLRTMYDTANGNVADIKAAKKKSAMFEESEDSEDS